MLKNITLSAKENLIKKARKKAVKENSSLNREFRKWLENYTYGEGNSQDIKSFLKKTDYVDAGRKFSREELNER